MLWQSVVDGVNRSDDSDVLSRRPHFHLIKLDYRLMFIEIAVNNLRALNFYRGSRKRCHLSTRIHSKLSRSPRFRSNHRIYHIKCANILFSASLLRLFLSRQTNIADTARKNSHSNYRIKVLLLSFFCLLSSRSFVSLFCQRLEWKTQRLDSQSCKLPIRL